MPPLRKRFSNNYGGLDFLFDLLFCLLSLVSCS